MNTNPPSMSSPTDSVYVKDNPASFVIADANLMLKHARRAHQSGDILNEAALSRITVLMYCVALEAVVNFIYEYSETPANRWRALSLKEKWLRVSTECLPRHGIIEVSGRVRYRPGDPIETFKENEKPFSLFLELKAFRDNLVHLKPIFTNVSAAEVDSHLDRNELYPITRLPRHLKNVRFEHAQVAANVFRQMTKQVDIFMKGIILHILSAPVLIESYSPEHPEEISPDPAA